MPDNPEPPDPGLVLSTALCDSLRDFAGKGFKPDSDATLEIARTLAKRRPKTTVEEVRRVVEAKATEWHDDPEQRAWLRPSTLFAYANFTKYLVELDEGASSNGTGKPILVDLE